MKPETKIKAITAISEAASKLSKAIQDGQYQYIELIINRLKLDLVTIRMSDKVFPKGGIHSGNNHLTPDQLGFVSTIERGENGEKIVTYGEILSDAKPDEESIVLPYRVAESEEDFAKKG